MPTEGTIDVLPTDSRNVSPMSRERERRQRVQHEKRLTPPDQRWSDTVTDGTWERRRNMKTRTEFVTRRDGREPADATRMEVSRGR